MIAWTGSVSPATAQRDPAPSLVRYDEDWSVLANPARRTGRWTEAYKYRPLAPGAWLTTGLELRARNETSSGLGWGDLPNQSDHWVRALPYADLRLGVVQLFVQPVSAYSAGVRPSRSPIDQTRTDWLQGFAAATLRREGTEVGLRIGRQMAPLGSQRLVSARYGPNLPLAFDGARLTVARGEAEVSAFDFRPVQAGPEDFDDRASESRRLRGLYVRRPGYDLYLLDYEDQAAVYTAASGRETRRSFGLRLDGAREAWRWDLEAVAQTGHIGGHRIRAWTLASEIGRRLAGPPVPVEASVRLDIASGDGDPGDRTVGTFNALFPRGKYFGELSPIGPANLIHLSPQIRADVSPRTRLSLASMAYWRQSRSDGLYDMSRSVTRRPDGAPDRFVGGQVEVLVEYQATKAWGMSASGSVFLPGDFIRRTGPSQTTLMVGLETSLKF